MANEFKIKKGLIVTGADGGTVVDIQGSQGQLFSVTDDLSGSIFAVSDISGVPILDVNSSGLSTFYGDVNLPDNKKILLGTGNDLELYHDASHSYIKDIGVGDLKISSNTVRIESNAAENMIIAIANGGVSSYYNNVKKLETTSSGASVTGVATINAGTTNVGLEIFSTNAGSYVRFDDGANANRFYLGVNNGDFGIYNNANEKPFEIASTGNATFTAQAFSAATSSGNASSTLTTKGYVDSLITGATIYRGAWQAGISATSSAATTASTTLTVTAAILDADGNTPVLVGAVVTGAGITGIVKVASVTSSTVYVLDTAIDATATAYIFSPIYGAPSLDGVTQTSGYYYICSEAGSATPNGANSEPNTWNVGDWCIYNDVSGTGQWQKIDNSSVLSGAGTGQTVALWEGPGSVTDSDTLGNAPITVSGSDTTFAGLITGQDSGSVQLNLKRGSSGTDGNTSILFTQPLGNGYIGVDANGSFSYGIAANLASSKLKVDRSGNGTFEGTIEATKLSVASTNAADIPLTLGSVNQTNYTLQEWRTSSHGLTEAYILAYGANHPSQAGNFAMKNLESGGEIFFELASNVVPLRMTSTGSTFAGDVTAPTFLGDLNGTINTATTGATQTAGDNSTLIATTAFVTAAVAAAPQGDITGSGTAGYIPKWGTTSALANSSTLYNGTSGLLNINNTFSGSPTGSSSSPDLWITGSATDSQAVVALMNAKTTSTANQVNGDIEFGTKDDGSAGYVSARIRGIQTSASGTGSAGRGELQFATNVSSTGTSPETRMVIDYEGKVGIGTDDPGAKLEVFGTGNSFRLDSAANGSKEILFRNVGTGTATIKTDGDLKLFVEDANKNILFDTNGGEKMRIEAGGNVGIGTSTPNAKLDIQGTQGQLFSVTDDLSGDIFSVADISGVPIMNVNSDGTSYFDGNVGIGTASPGAKLHVDGTAIFDTQTGAQPFYITRDGAADQALKIYVDDSAAIFESIQDETADNYGAFQFILDAGVTEPYFDVRKGTALANTLFRVDGNGNVGIGDTGPNVKLQVSTNSPANNVAVSIGDGWVGNSSYHKEGGLLLISGTSQDATQTGAGIAFQTRNTANTNYWKSSMIMGRDGAIRFTLGGAGTGAGSEDFTILSNGNVGIGVTGPGVKLDIAGTDSTYIAKFTHSTASGYAPGSILLEAGQSNSRGQGIYHYNNVADENWFTGVPYNVQSKKWIVANKYSTTQSTDTAQLTNALMTIDSDTGNVGIGTTNPSTKLQLTGTGSDTTLGLSITNTDGANMSFRKKSGFNNTLEIVNANNDIDIITGTSSRIFIESSNGNVGIGTGTPGDKLHVNGTVRSQAPTTSDWGFLGYNSAGTASSGLWFENGDGQLLLRDDQNNLNVRINSDTNSYINGGNLGLGTTGPAQKLTINSGRMLITNNTTPIYIKVNSTYKSWVHHISSDFGYIFAPSTAVGGETWDWANQTRLGANGVVRAKNFELSSDERFKDNVKDIKDNEIKVAFKSFEIKSSPGEKRYGVIAQELEKNNPELVTTDTEGFKSVKYIDLLIAKIAELEARLEKLEK